MENDLPVGEHIENVDDDDFFEDYQSIPVEDASTINNKYLYLNEHKGSISYTEPLAFETDVKSIIDTSFPIVKNDKEFDYEHVKFSNTLSLLELCHYGEKMQDTKDNNHLRSLYKNDEEFDFARPWSQWTAFKCLLTALHLDSKQLNHTTHKILQPVKLSQATFPNSLAEPSFSQSNGSLVSANLKDSKESCHFPLDDTLNPLNQGAKSNVSINHHHSMPITSIVVEKPLNINADVAPLSKPKKENDFVKRFLSDLPDLSFMRSRGVVVNKEKS